MFCLSSLNVHFWFFLNTFLWHINDFSLSFYDICFGFCDMAWGLRPSGYFLFGPWGGGLTLMYVVSLVPMFFFFDIALFPLWSLPCLLCHTHCTVVTLNLRNNSTEFAIFPKWQGGHQIQRHAQNVQWYYKRKFAWSKWLILSNNVLWQKKMYTHIFFYLANFNYLFHTLKLAEQRLGRTKIASIQRKKKCIN